MRTFTVRIENERDAELLQKLLKETKFEAKVETFVEEEDIDDDELRLVEERYTEYLKDPSKAQEWQDVRAQIKLKYGL